ncbi:helix-turn-helix domain-containing protein [Halostella litorea]|uniref:helix-turn-helix domain-containing protein n=1 Tax=Halostella litorea TaxID=2528831 RepID=UPI001386EE3D|nr:helix-turn-helix domain-containing protein [Halostella litorea]
MKSLELVVEHAAETIHPMHAFVCESPAVEREVLLEGKTVDGERTLLFYVEGDHEAYEATLAAQDAVAEYDVRPDSDGEFFVYVSSSNSDREATLIEAFAGDAVVVVPPVEFRADRTMRLTVVGRGPDLRDLLDSLPEALDVDVRSVGPFTRGLSPSLTERQREALVAARGVGYYEVPREGGVEAVATELDCAVSTASTLLRRAESRLVADALGDRP